MSGNASSLAGKTLFITGSSRGIGRAIALRAAADGANVAIVAKTTVAHPKLPGTIHTVAAEVEEAGGKALALRCDIRDEEQVISAVDRTVTEFGGIDVLVNNASAISLTGTLETPMKRVDLMWSVNARGTYVCSRACLPHLIEAENPHILTLSPPLNMEAGWFQNHCAYTISKYGMSMCVLGMAEEFRSAGVAVNALWPRTVINTAAIRMLGGLIHPEHCRRPEILADAAHWILTQNSREISGRFLIDDEILARAGVDDLGSYSVEPGATLATDLFVGDPAHLAELLKQRDDS